MLVQMIDGAGHPNEVTAVDGARPPNEDTAVVSIQRQRRLHRMSIRSQRTDNYRLA